MTSAWCHH